MSTSVLSVGVLPAPKVFLRKGFGPAVNIGASGLYYKGVSLIGGDVTWTLHEPEEGVSWGFRVSYSSSNVLYAKTQTVRPEFLVSRALEFADPYLGIGAQIAWGTLTVDVEPIPGFTQQITASGRAQSFVAFLGNKFRIPGLNLLIAVEGGYSSAGMSWLAARTGIGF